MAVETAAAEEIPVPPWQRVCPVCNAQPGDSCTQPNSTTRLPVKWFHFKREDT